MRSRNNECDNTTAHLFKIGQTVQKKGVSKSDPAAFYRITGTLPSKGNSPQYRIRSHFEYHERVITQDLIELVSASPKNNDETLIEKTFRKPINQSANLSRRKSVTLGVFRCKRLDLI